MRQSFREGYTLPLAGRITAEMRRLACGDFLNTLQAGTQLDSSRGSIRVDSQHGAHNGQKVLNHDPCQKKEPGSVGHTRHPPA